MRAPVGINRRLIIAVCAVIAIAVIFTSRLVDLQIGQASELSAASRGEHAIIQTTYGDRGKITDRNGVVLADTVRRYNVTAAPAYAASFQKKNAAGVVSTFSVRDALTQIAAITSTTVPGTTVDSMMASITANPKSNFAYLVKSINSDEYSKVVALHIPFVYLERSSATTYPDGAVAGNLVGFVGTDGAQAGIEYAQDKCLTGSNGSQTYQGGADGVEIPGSLVTKTTAKPGGTVKTTIDSDLQFSVQQVLDQQAQALGAVSATAIVMKVSDASLLTVADYPSVDPNNVGGTDVGNLSSKAFTDLYEPGSTFKAITAASLIDAGKATPATQAVVPDVRTFPWGGSIHDAEYHPTEHLTLTGVLQNSSNVGITELGQDLSAQQRYEYMLKFGLGSPSAVAFPGEPRLALRPASKWDAATNYNSMYGQGISVTAIQLANAYEALANHGVREPVKLVESCTASDGTVTEIPSSTATRVVSATAADETVAMLRNVLTAGTLDSMTPIPGYEIAAKTGTAQVADRAGGGYGDDFITSVAGMLPAKNPQYVVLVTFNKPSIDKTSAAVAPAFRAIASDVLQAYAVLPSTAHDPLLSSTW